MEKKNMTTVTVELIVNMLKKWYSEKKYFFDEEFDFYCGITNDPDERKIQHESQDHGGNNITIMIAVKCKDKDIASTVENKMEEEGFDIGNPPHEANGAEENSKWVYLYKKP